MKRLEQVLLAARQVLYDRFEELSEKSRNDYPMLFGHNLWLESDKIKEEDKLRRALKHGILGIGFNGLYEALLAIYKKNKIENIKEAQELGIEIIKTIRKKCDKFSEENNLNYQVIALPEDYDKDMFIDIDQIIHGKIKGVTDKEYYTNSFHVPVYYEISAFDKIKLEGPYHALTNAGHITYVELDGDPLKNLGAFEEVVRAMKDAGVGYGSINHPVDRDPVCGFTGIIENECPHCKRNADEKESGSERINRIKVD